MGRVYRSQNLDLGNWGPKDKWPTNVKSPAVYLFIPHFTTKPHSIPME